MLVEVTLSLLVIVLLWYSFKKPANYPPGYWGIPILGYIPFGKKSFENIITDLYKKYGDVVSWRIGSMFVVFLFDYKMIKQCYQRADLMGKPKKFGVLFLLNKKKTPVSTSGTRLATVKRFTLRHMKNLGMEKSNLTKAVQYEALELTKNLKVNAGVPTEIGTSLVISILNVIWQWVAGKRYDLCDKKQLEMDKLRSVLQDNFMQAAITDIFPCIKYILPASYFNRTASYRSQQKLLVMLNDFLEELISEHKKTLDPSDIRDFTDAYLLEMEKSKDDPDSVFSEEGLKERIADFYGAGSDTIVITLRWVFYYLASFPKIQQRLQREIDEQLPDDGQMATMEDILRFPYTEAFIHEVLRYSSLATIGTFHAATRDTTLGGYFIPKGTLVQTGSYCIHNNPKYFDSPEEFRPERFLDAVGKFLFPKEGFLAFGTGRRSCVGEILAKMQLFIYITTIVKHLSFSAPPDVEIDLKPLKASPLFRRPDSTQKLIINIR